VASSRWSEISSYWFQTRERRLILNRIPRIGSEAVKGSYSRARPYAKHRRGKVNEKTRSTAARKLIKMSAEKRPLKSNARFIEPMLCLSASSLLRGNEWEYKLKLDGTGH
jgi:hypothetical protein